MSSKKHIFVTSISDVCPHDNIQLNIKSGKRIVFHPGKEEYDIYECPFCKREYVFYVEDRKLISKFDKMCELEGFRYEFKYKYLPTSSSEQKQLKLKHINEKTEKEIIEEEFFKKYSYLLYNYHLTLKKFMLITGKSEELFKKIKGSYNTLNTKFSEAFNDEKMPEDIKQILNELEIRAENDKYRNCEEKRRVYQEKMRNTADHVKYNKYYYEKNMKKRDSGREKKENEFFEENLSLADILWNTISEASTSFEFVGFHHHLNFEQFVSVMNEKKLYSRNDMIINLPNNMVDVASESVMKNTDGEVLDYVRFYFGPKTPTYYRNEGIFECEFGASESNVPIPVALVFCKDILKIKGVRISPVNAATTGNIPTYSYKKAIDFDWVSIMGRGKIEGNIYYEVKCRNAELHVPHSVNVRYLYKVYFRTPADLKHAQFVLGENELFQVDESMFEKIDERSTCFLYDYSAKNAEDGYVISLFFQKKPNNYKHEIVIHFKDGKQEKRTLLLNKRKKDKRCSTYNPYKYVQKISVSNIFDVEYCEYLMNENVSAIWR